MDNYILLKLERSPGVWSSLWKKEDGPYMLESLSLLRNSDKQDFPCMRPHNLSQATVFLTFFWGSSKSKRNSYLEVESQAAQTTKPPQARDSVRVACCSL